MFKKFLFHIIIILIFNFFNIRCESAEEFCNKPENFDNILCLSVSKQYLTNLIELNPFELNYTEIEEFSSLDETGKNNFLIDFQKNITEFSEKDSGEFKE